MRKIILIALLCAIPLFAAAPTQLTLGQVATSLSLVTATGAGTAFALPVAPTGKTNAYTWTVTFKTAAPGAQTTNLEGSLDNVNWYQLDQSTTLAYTSDSQSGEMRHVIYKPVNYVRCNLASYTQGGNAGVTCTLLVGGNS